MGLAWTSTNKNFWFQDFPTFFQKKSQLTSASTVLFTLPFAPHVGGPRGRRSSGGAAWLGGAELRAEQGERSRWGGRLGVFH